MSSTGVSASAAAAISVASSTRGLSCFSDAPSASSEDEVESAVVASHSEADEAESDAEKQGPFTFRRKLHCNYLAVSVGFLALLIFSGEEKRPCDICAADDL